ncbi:hypothetical protein V3664_16510 [Streptomyces sp. CS62]
MAEALLDFAGIPVRSTIAAPRRRPGPSGGFPVTVPVPPAVPPRGLSGRADPGRPRARAAR